MIDEGARGDAVTRGTTRGEGKGGRRWMSARDVVFARRVILTTNTVYHGFKERYCENDATNERANDASRSRESALGVGRGAYVGFQGREDLSQGVVDALGVGGEEADDDAVRTVNLFFELARGDEHTCGIVFDQF